MKKLFFSLVMSGLFFTACSSDDTPSDPQAQKAVGGLKGAITFEQTSAKAAQSTAIPLTSWRNITQAQLFLYDPATGEIAYSDIINPYNGGTPRVTFNWTNIPVGTYDVALVANAKSSVNSISTFIGGATPIEWGQYNVKGKKVNDEVFMRLKSATLPAVHTSLSAAHAAQKGYAEPAEVFTAYATNIQITEGVIKDLTASPLTLKRTVSLLRVRVDRSAVPAGVKFDDAKTSLLIQRQPQKLALKKGTFAGGIVASEASSINELLVGGSGANTFNKTNPTAATHSNPTILTGNFTLWRDVVVFPNVAASEGKAPSAEAENNRKYIVRVSALAPVGYVLDDGTTLTQPTVLWWYGYVPHVFASNTIREVNLKLTSGGIPNIPDVPEAQGGLEIQLTAPAPWDSNIESSNIEL